MAQQALATTRSTNLTSDELPEPTLDVRDLFAKLRTMFPQKFERRYTARREETTRRRFLTMALEWDEKLQGIDRKMMRYGLNKLSAEVESKQREGKEAWPPSADQFAALCRVKPRDVGMPTADEAYTAAKLRSWDLDPAIYAAAKCLTADEWRKGDWFCLPRFRKFYQEFVERKAAGCPVQYKQVSTNLLAHQKPSKEEMQKVFDGMKKAARGEK